jgi:hypothetical protein
VAVAPGPRRSRSLDAIDGRVSPSPDACSAHVRSPPRFRVFVAAMPFGCHARGCSVVHKVRGISFVTCIDPVAREPRGPRILVFRSIRQARGPTQAAFRKRALSMGKSTEPTATPG